jgi:Chaperone of endosialidase/Secretion system C-terminal sorting domain
MKLKIPSVMMTLVAVISSLLHETIAQNTSPYWSLAGNSNATAASKLGTTNAIPIRLYTNNALRMIIQPNGNIGLGTSAPAYKLHVTIGSGTAVYGNGTTGVSGNGTTYGVYGNSTNNYGVYGNSGYTGVYGTGTSYGVYGYSANGYGVYGSSGYLGVLGSGTTYGLYGSGGTYGLYSSGTSYGVYSSSSSGVGVYGNSTSNYGISGNSSSNYAVYGNGYIGTYGQGSYVGAWGNGTSYGLVGYGGPYGVWAQGTSWGGYFSGSVYSTGTYQGSDKLLKQNIKEFNSAMDIINKLKPRQYEFRHDGNYGKMNLPEGNHFGLIAQDVEEVLPHLVKDAKFETDLIKPVVNGNPSSADADIKSETINFKALNYTELIPVILKGMQEQDIIIKQQQQQIDELKNLIAELTGKQNVSGVLTKEEAFIKQNLPNPFNENTVIQFYVPLTAKQAQIVLYDQTGRLLKSYSVGSGKSQVTIDKGTLASGNYVYTLMVDGKKIDSKSMILTK